MTDNVNDMITGWLDDAEPSSRERADTSDLEASEQLADSLVVHGLLVDMVGRDENRDEQRIRDLMQQIERELASAVVVDGTTHATQAKHRRFAILTSVLTIAAAALFMFTMLVPQQNVSAAMASLEKIVAAAAKPLDRTYQIRLVEEYDRNKRPRNLSRDAWKREAPEEIDGATIHVRGANEYVMKVMLKTGETRTSGCDGQASWSFRENGPVHVSSNLNRFRGGMPGNQQDMPFVNIHANLEQLKVGYEIDLIDEPVSSDGTSLSHLRCVRKLDVQRGIKQVDLWFDSEDGTVHKMLLDGLPRGRGGPKSVKFELIDQSEFAPDFFSHESHHELGRRVKYEEGVK